MNFNDLILELSNLGVKLWANGDDLHVHAPKGILTIELRNLLTLHKAELMLRLQSNSMNTKIPAPLHILELADDTSKLMSDDIEDIYPLAQMQELMLNVYLNNKKSQNTGIYHCQQSFEICDDDFCLEAFKTALEILVQKHQVLRTIFVIQNLKQPIQMVKKKLDFTIEEQNISGLKPDEQEQYIDDFMNYDVCNLFDIENKSQPLFRFCFFIKSPNKFEFFISIHHAIADGWGHFEFLKELYNLYLKLKKGENIKVVSGINVYKEFIALEKEIITSKEASIFWMSYLNKYSHKPLQQLKESINEIEAHSEKYILNSKLTFGLHKLCENLGVSLKAIFLSAYIDLIGIEIQKSIVSVGIVTNGRTERLSDPLTALGLFWNIVPFCETILDNKDLQIQNVQKRLIQIEPYIHYPLLKILKDRQESDLFSDLFFATFNFIHFHNSKNTFLNLDCKWNFKRYHDKFHFPLNYIILKNTFEENISVRVEYDKIYFCSQDISLMLKKYVDILWNVVAN